MECLRLEIVQQGAIAPQIVTGAETLPPIFDHRGNDRRKYRAGLLPRRMEKRPALA
jgi:hypothetical protein